MPFPTGSSQGRVPNVPVLNEDFAETVARAFLRYWIIVYDTSLEGMIVFLSLFFLTFFGSREGSVSRWVFLCILVSSVFQTDLELTEITCSTSQVLGLKR